MILLGVDLLQNVGSLFHKLSLFIKLAFKFWSKNRNYVEISQVYTAQWCVSGQWC